MSGGFRHFTGTGVVVYTRHAERRAQERGIDLNRASDLISEWHTMHRGRDDCSVLRGTIEGQELKLVVRQESDRIIVITVADVQVGAP